MIERNHFNVLYHPVIDMVTGMWIGAESQLCGTVLNSPWRTERAAVERIRGQRIQHLTRWTCHEVVKDFAQTFWACDDFYIAIRLCTEDILDPQFSDFINQLIIKYNVPASCIAFEFADTLAMAGNRLAVKLNRLRGQGHLIALYDFVSSDCSVSFLESLPVDIIKIDKTLSGAMDCCQVVSSLPLLLERAKMLDIDVVITDVKTDMQAKRIRAIGGTKVQGQLYSKALCAHDFTRTYFTRPHPCRLNVI